MSNTPSEGLKDSVRAHWEREPCGTRGLVAEDHAALFARLEAERYRQEPYIPDFARFERARGKRLLEVGVGAGTDFVNWVRSGALATGVDLTQAAVDMTRERLALEGLDAEVRTADAERLPFPDATFDVVYSHGVLHHTPDTERAVAEVYRVLKPGGTALVMVYHTPSWSGLMLWAIHSAARGRPWESPRRAVYEHLESPGTKSYTREEARRLFGAFASVRTDVALGAGDLLLMAPSEKYRARWHAMAWRLYPRPLVRRFGARLGTALLVEATR